MGKVIKWKKRGDDASSRHVVKTKTKRITYKKAEK